VSVRRADKDRALREIAARLRAAAAEGPSSAILAANAEDLAAARAAGLDEAMVDRLALDPKRLGAIASAVDEIAQLDDPVGEVLGMRAARTGCASGRCGCRSG
jgi:glutamate-5-semialdehyde dehydrogenase